MMTTSFLTRRAARMLVGLATLSVAVACNDSTGPDDDHAEEVAEIRLVVTPPAGTATTYAIAANGAMTPTPIALRVGTSTVTAQVFDEDGVNITSELGDDFQVRLYNLTGNLTFARTNAFSGTITAPAGSVGAQEMDVDLFHLEEEHADFGEFTVDVVVAN